MAKTSDDDIWRDAYRHKVTPPWEDEPTENRRSIARWPYASETMAVDVGEISIAQEKLRRHGVTTEYDKLGRPILRDAAHRKAHAKVFGYYDRNASYSDPDPVNYVESEHSAGAVRRKRAEMRDTIRQEIVRLEREIAAGYN